MVEQQADAEVRDEADVAEGAFQRLADVVIHTDGLCTHQHRADRTVDGHGDDGDHGGFDVERDAQGAVEEHQDNAHHHGNDHDHSHAVGDAVGHCAEAAGQTHRVAHREVDVAGGVDEGHGGGHRAGDETLVDDALEDALFQEFTARCNGEEDEDDHQHRQRENQWEEAVVFEDVDPIHHGQVGMVFFLYCCG